MLRYEVIAFDADDTLWHNERLYTQAKAEFKKLLSEYHEPEWIEEHLYRTEVGNLEQFGYGIKAFALAMMEAAVEVSGGRIGGDEIQTIIGLAKEMLAADVELLEPVAETLESLANTYPLMLITKGDLYDQQLKIARSGLAERFRQIEIVSEKTPASYDQILQRYGIVPERFLMVGNSIRSDILPVLALGASAVHVPYPLTWAHEVIEPPAPEQVGFYEIEHLGLLPGLLERLEGE